jgi:hypothetical protein
VQALSVVVFCGPTLPQALAQPLLPDANLRGPAECGDVYETVRTGATIVGIVDGYFDHRLPVWHKEILWAMSQGAHVYGASSMGALRAAELHSFGMVGVGTVFEWFRDGVLESDDEVAVLHEAPERGLRPRSVALVNLRCTIHEAMRVGAIDEVAGENVIRELQALYYPERGIPALRAAIDLVAPDRKVAFTSFLAERGLVDQKRDDAVAMLRRIRKDVGTPGRSASSFRFQHTNAWQSLIERFELASAAATDAEGKQGEPLRGEEHLRRALGRLARIDPVLYARVVRGALERALALALAARDGTGADSAQMQGTSEELRLERGLLTPAQTNAWLRTNGLDVERFSLLVHDTVLSRRFGEEANAAFFKEVPAILRLLGVYERVVDM